jgi:hypothetical protein
MELQQAFTPVNFTPGRGGKTVTTLVLHTMVGSMQSSQNVFFNAAKQVSAHYGVGLDGTLRQWVSEGDTAWHAGNWLVNESSIGVEHEDNGNYNDAVRTDAEYASSARLVADICHRYNIPCKLANVDPNTKMPTEPGIVTHKQVDTLPGSTGCPDGLDVDRIIREAQALLGGETQPTVEVTNSASGTVTPWGPDNVLITVSTLNVHNVLPTVTDGEDAGNFANTPDGKVHYHNLVKVVGYARGLLVNQNGGSSDLWLMDQYDRWLWGFDTDFFMAAPNVPLIEEPSAPPSPPEPVAPDYESTYKDDVATWTVQVPCVALDASGSGAPKQIAAGAIVNQAGTFTHNDVSFARTVYGKEHGTWYGVPLSASIAPTPPSPASAPVTGPPNKSVDSVQPPQTTTVAPAPSISPGVEPTVSAGKLTPIQWIAGLLAAAYGAITRSRKGGK